MKMTYAYAVLYPSGGWGATGIGEQDRPRLEILAAATHGVVIELGPVVADYRETGVPERTSNDD